MKKAIIVSLKFHPGHISHLIASYKQFRELGYDTYFFVHAEFAKYLSDYKDNVLIYRKDKLQNISISLFLFPAINNIIEMFKQKISGSKIIYVFHEPVEPYSKYLAVGYSKIYVFKKILANFLYRIMVRLSNTVILPSRKSLEMFEANKGYKNKNYYYLPLMFDDERKLQQNNSICREYFSYIGTIAIDHCFTECQEFILRSIENNGDNGFNFLIATKNTIARTERIQKAIETGKLKIIDGEPMTNEEINEHYASSFGIWNAYSRTNQSGVLPKAFMFGTPALVMRKNLNEFTHDCENVVAIDDNTNFEEIEAAVKKIHDNFDVFSSASRKEFEKSFYYRVYNERFREIVNGKSQGK